MGREMCMWNPPFFHPYICEKKSCSLAAHTCQKTNIITWWSDGSHHNINVLHTRRMNWVIFFAKDINKICIPLFNSVNLMTDFPSRVNKTCSFHDPDVMPMEFKSKVNMGPTKKNLVCWWCFQKVSAFANHSFWYDEKEKSLCQSRIQAHIPSIVLICVVWSTEEFAFSGEQHSNVHCVNWTVLMTETHKSSKSTGWWLRPKNCKEIFCEKNKKIPPCVWNCAFVAATKPIFKTTTQPLSPTTRSSTEQESESGSEGKQFLHKQGDHQNFLHFFWHQSKEFSVSASQRFSRAKGNYQVVTQKWQKKILHWLPAVACIIWKSACFELFIPASSLWAKKNPLRSHQNAVQWHTKASTSVFRWKKARKGSVLAKVLQGEKMMAEAEMKDTNSMNLRVNSS